MIWSKRLHKLSYKLVVNTKHILNVIENCSMTAKSLLNYSNIADYQNPQQIYCSEVRSFLLMFKGKKCPGAINRHFVLHDLKLISNRIQF